MQSGLSVIKLDEENKRRSQTKREKALDKGIVKYFYNKLIKEKKTRKQIEEELKLGQGALSDKKYAKPIMKEMNNMLQAAPKAKDFARQHGDIELNLFYAALHKYVESKP